MFLQVPTEKYDKKKSGIFLPILHCPVVPKRLFCNFSTSKNILMKFQMIKRNFRFGLENIKFRAGQGHVGTKHTFSHKCMFSTHMNEFK